MIGTTCTLVRVIAAGWGRLAHVPARRCPTRGAGAVHVADLAPLVADELRVSPADVRPDARLAEDLGMDSLGLLLLLLRIEETVGGAWVIETFPPVTTVQDLCDAVTEQVTEQEVVR